MRNTDDARRALERGHDYDVVLVDIDRSTLRSTELEDVARDLPVLVLSSHEDQSVAIRMIGAGAEDFLCDSMLELDPIVLCHALTCAVTRFRHVRAELEKRDEVIHENEKILNWMIGTYMK